MSYTNDVAVGYSPINIGIDSPLNTISVQNSPVTDIGVISLDLTPTGVIAGTYANPTLTLSYTGQVVAASSVSNKILERIVLSSKTLTISNPVITADTPITSVDLMPILANTPGVVGKPIKNPVLTIDVEGRVTVATTEDPVPGLGTVKEVRIGCPNNSLTVSQRPITTTGTLEVGLPVIPGIPAGKILYSPSIQTDRFGRVVKINPQPTLNIVSTTGTITAKQIPDTGAVDLGVNSDFSLVGLQTFRNIKSITKNAYGQIVDIVGDVSISLFSDIADVTVDKSSDSAFGKVSNNLIKAEDIVFLQPYVTSDAGLRRVSATSGYGPTTNQVGQGEFSYTKMLKPVRGNATYKALTTSQLGTAQYYVAWKQIYRPTIDVRFPNVNVPGCLADDVVFIQMVSGVKNKGFRPIVSSDDAMLSPIVQSVSKDTVKFGALNPPLNSDMSVNGYYILVGFRKGNGTDSKIRIVNSGAEGSPYVGADQDNIQKIWCYGLTPGITTKNGIESPNSVVILQASVRSSDAGLLPDTETACLTPTLYVEDITANFQHTNFFYAQKMRAPVAGAYGAYSWMAISDV